MKITSALCILILCLFKSSTSYEKVCMIVCPEGQIITPPCNCVDKPMCFPKFCRPGQYFNKKSCKCEFEEEDKDNYPEFCKSKFCGKGYYLDYSLCKCIKIDLSPICEPQICDKGFVFNEEYCECIPSFLPKRCVLPKSCPSGQYFSALLCKCIKPVYCIQSVCQNLMGRNPETCACNIKSCPGSPCKEGYVRNIIDCKCTPRELPKSQCGISKCHPKYRLNKKRCECKKKMGVVCEKACLHGLEIFPGKCKCVKPPKCNITQCKYGYYLDYEDCKCVEI